MNFWREFHGPNAAYLLSLFEQFEQDPQSVNQAARTFFQKNKADLQRLQGSNGHAPPATAVAPRTDKVMAAVNLAGAVREYGHLAAQLDPLGTPPPGEPSLALEYHGLSEEDLRQLPASIIGGPAGEGGNALEAVQNLRRIYSDTIGYDYDHLRNHEERRWLRQMAETRHFRPPQTPIDGRALLERLTQVETFEQFLHHIFPGKSRFSIEGLDMLVPMLDEIVARVVSDGICNILIGMAHRGRLNVMAHILQRPYAQILTMFKDPAQRDFYDKRNVMGWTGDVKYHAGDRRAIDFDEDESIDLVIKLAPNPSHLEHVNPVLLGMARAAGTRVDSPGAPQFNPAITLPIVIHGDAAFPGQGVVAETLNLHALPGYWVGGAVHIIANNQLGFTTTAVEGRSTLYASDLAKGFKIPIVHVNVDDPEACLEAARLAVAYRQTFQKDFLVDLIGYRRYGHNEGDEPRFTQPQMYARIDDLPTVRQQWAEELSARGEINADEAEKMVQTYRSQLQELYESLEVEAVADELEPQLAMPPPGAAREADTAVPLDQLRQLNQSLLDFPAGFQPDPKLARALKKRRQVLDNADETTIDWATAEELALASILASGTAVRLTGEDVKRGTFSQRHAVFHDTATGETICPLQTIPQAQAAFEIHNSPLSENATLGFEYGYNVQAPERLVIWEAQYGDFVNTAQAMIDEFLAAGKAKWEQTPSLVLLLPHGYEGQGPDHSSGRLERFLQLAAKNSLRIAYPTTAAQYFHLLRRQTAVLVEDPLPLIVMTPKSLLRHSRSASTPRQLAEGDWQPVIPDPLAQEHAEDIRRLVLCSGKVFVDLVEIQEKRLEAQDKVQVALVRVEQLYPLPEEAIAGEVTRYPNLDEVVWLQEEPANMGAWKFVQPCIEELLKGELPLRYIGRPRRTSPAEGSTAWHRRNQQAITEFAFSLD
ncbi:MAG: 2-oxoglutarate dehydrogenase E1 component [Ardenticatenaceae bacterium]|nr:2-oxoglutarate dehydrogenase E1 component [Ardenticatenaceae bacterium]